MISMIKHHVCVKALLVIWTLLLGSAVAQAQVEFRYHKYQEYTIVLPERIYHDELNTLCEIIVDRQRPPFEAAGYLVTVLGVDHLFGNLFDCNGQAENADAVFELGGNITGSCQKHDAGPMPFGSRFPQTAPDPENQCRCQAPHRFDEALQWCIDDGPDKNDGCADPANHSANPCNVATGNKYRYETDISSGSLRFTRSYNSRNLFNFGLGKGWRHNYQKSLSRNNSFTIELVSEKGRGEQWRKIGGAWVGDTDSDFIFTETSTGYQVTNSDTSVDNYSRNGRITSSIDTNGSRTEYQYNQFGDLLSVENHYGHTLTFEYSRNTLTSVTDAQGATYQYEYDESGNLAAVVFPDQTPADNTDNPRKIYHYENQDFPYHLTGITNERGERYGNFAYDQNGKAILSELGTTTNPVGQERVELDYQGGN